jgi:hypothetical protein
MRKSGFFYQYALETIMYSLAYKGWVSKTPEELIWGYEETLFDLAKLTMPNPPDLDKFGFFTKKNASSDLSTYTMFTGEDNPYNLSKISMYNGKDSLNKWSQPQCNQVQGSDGATFNPYIQKVIEDKCKNKIRRSINIERSNTRLVRYSNDHCPN